MFRKKKKGGHLGGLNIGDAHDPRVRGLYIYDALRYTACPRCFWRILRQGTTRQGSMIRFTTPAASSRHNQFYAMKCDDQNIKKDIDIYPPLLRLKNLSEKQEAM